MSLTHVTATRNILADDVVDQLDSGDFMFTLADGTTEVATVDLSATAFGAAAVGIATMADTPLSDSSATGNASPIAKFLARTSGAAEVFRGSVGTSGEDINLTSLTIGATDTLTLSSFTYESSV